MQPSNVNFSSFVETEMYLHVFLYLELRCKLCGNFDPTDPTHYKSHPAEGKKERNQGGETKVGKT